MQVVSARALEAESDKVALEALALGQALVLGWALEAVWAPKTQVVCFGPSDCCAEPKEVYFSRPDHWFSVLHVQPLHTASWL